ncbi:hypothetical protein OUZ56_006434 [Daphnia magna]|uniref:Uncharacterized protein n=1 Tax=Daphnia magna TaxID=35525 RepID=A0ABQ9YVM7_9CRUS|nr:hypothetical protein OUZ56_006434 [Daphnia magna]
MTTKTLHSRKQNGDTHSEIPAATAGYAKVAYCVVGAGTSGWALGGRELLLRLRRSSAFYLVRSLRCRREMEKKAANLHPVYGAVLNRWYEEELEAV